VAELNNRVAFIDFVRGLLTINPLERWSPQQAKMHPFITQQKYIGPFIPPMNLKASSLNRTPAPGTQQQQQAEALSKQRAQQAQATASASGAYSSITPGQYQQPAAHAQPQQPTLYGSSNNNMYTPATASHTGQPPPYAAQPNAYGQMSTGQPPAQMPAANYGAVPPQANMYGSQPSSRTRQRASTMEQQQSGIPAAIQRVASHLDPNQPIRLQPSPAYYPPPPDGAQGLMDQAGSSRNAAGRRGSRPQQQQGRGNRDFIRTLEERTLEEGFMGGGQSQWQ
jgi:dual specificity protein kinase YAK1